MDEMRSRKGNSIIAIPDTYIVIDIETTGRSSRFNEIIEIAAIKVCNNTVINSFSTLVKPVAKIPSSITELTGITNEMVATAPNISSVLKKYIDFFEDYILIGHNINFDINFIYDFAEREHLTPPSNDFVDTLRIFRKLYPGLTHHRLCDLAQIYQIDCSNAHRSLADCEITFKCFSILADEIIQKFSNIETFIANTTLGSSSGKKLKASDISANTKTIDPDNPLYGKTFVFTGALDKMPRRDAMQIVVNHGGINGDNVTKQTNYLVLGCTDYCSAIKGDKSTKYKKAESLMLAGQDIEIIPEDVFYDMISQ